MCVLTRRVCVCRGFSRRVYVFVCIVCGCGGCAGGVHAVCVVCVGGKCARRVYVCVCVLCLLVRRMWYN